VILQAANPRTITATLPGFTVADATAALAALVNIASDSVLSKNEKPGVVANYQTILLKQTSIDTEAGIFGAKTTGTYNTAITDLTTYLTGLTPAYNDYTTDTAIVGATLISKFNDVYVAEQVLHNEIATIASSGVLIGASNIQTVMVGANQINTPITSYSTTHVTSATVAASVEVIVASITITATGGPIFISACVQFSQGSHPGYAWLDLFKDCSTFDSGTTVGFPPPGVQLRNVSGYYDGSNVGTLVMEMSDTPSAGSHTYQLACGSSSAYYMDFYNSFMSVMEIKR